MLQKRGWGTFSNSLPERAVSFNFHLTPIQAPISFFSVTKGAVKSSNSKGGFRGGPKGTFFL